MKRIGIVGLGKMGSAMARRLLGAGYYVSVWNRTPRTMESLAAAGATAYLEIAALVQNVEAVIVSLWGDAVAREVTLAQILPAAQASQIVIECSTLSPAMYEELETQARSRGIAFLAAPVLGNPITVAEGALTILAGGSDAAFELARPLLSSLGNNLIHMSTPKASGFLKLANNTILGVFAVTLGELLEECNRAGIDRGLAVESLTGAFGRAANSKKQQLLEWDTTPRFALSALLKDLQLSREAAESVHVPVPVLDTVLAEAERVAASGFGDRDYIALAMEAATR